jgi:hypothetical protein
MKRIKLFEAFNNGDKIEKTNYFVLCWAIEGFFRENELQVELYYTPSKGGVKEKIKTFRLDEDGDKVSYFSYDPNYRLYIFCFDSLFHYLRKNKVFEGKSYSSMCPLIKNMLNKTIINTIKRKYYEKNKTI